jgi:hypothetical protein
MFWAIVIIGVLFLMIASPGFRVFALVVAAIIGCGLYYLITKQDSEWAVRQRSQAQEAQEQAEAERLRWGRIKPNEVEFRDVSFELVYSNHFDVKGAVKNNTDLVVTGIRFSAVPYDCPLGATRWAQCEKIGGDELYAYATVPPNEVRAVIATASLIPANKSPPTNAASTARKRSADSWARASACSKISGQTQGNAVADL